MKKVLILGYSSMIGGVETYIANLLKYIDKKKFTVDLLVQDDITGINAELTTIESSGDVVLLGYHKYP